MSMAVRGTGPGGRLEWELGRVGSYRTEASRPDVVRSLIPEVPLPLQRGPQAAAPPGWSATWRGNAKAPPPS